MVSISDHAVADHRGGDLMALELDPILKQALDGDSHHPIIEILSSPVTTDLSIEGYHLTGLVGEIQPQAIILESGKLAIAYVGEISGTSAHLNLILTDDDRIEQMDPVRLVPFSISSNADVTLTETAEGNIGVVYRSRTSVYRLVVSPFGTILNSYAGLSYNAIFPTRGNLSVVRLEDDTYLLAQALTNNNGVWGFLIRSSSNFLTWTYGTFFPALPLGQSQILRNPFLLQLSSGVVWLLFDAMETSNAINIYAMPSSDKGATWGQAVRITDNTEPTEKTQQPTAVQKTENRIDIAWTESLAVIAKEKSELQTSSYVYSDFMLFDPATRKLYILNVFTSYGNKYLQNIIRIDVDSWNIEKKWNKDSVPSYHPIFQQADVWWKRHRSTAGSRIGWGLLGARFQAAVLDGEADTITHYAFLDWPEQGITKNVSWDPLHSTLGMKGTFLDNQTDRFYVLLYDRNLSGKRDLQLGYIDLKDPGPEYTFRNIISTMNFTWVGYPAGGQEMFFKVYSDEDFIVLGTHVRVNDWTGGLHIIHLSTGGTYKTYDMATFPLFPSKGIRAAEYNNGSIYCSFPFLDTPPEQGKRGLLEIDLSTDFMTYHIPPWADIKDYAFTEITKITEHELLIVSDTQGSAIFNTLTKGWIHYGAEEMTGYSNFQYSGAYDPVQEMVFTGGDKVFAFLRSGPIKQLFVRSLTPTFSQLKDDQKLTRSFRDDTPSLAIPEGESNFYAFWRRSNIELDEWISWGMESSARYLEDYLTSAGVSMKYSVDGTPNEVAMVFSNGHLFDPHNLASLWHIYLRKGRQVTIWMGEKVEGQPYLKLMGRFLVTGLRMKYQMGLYPVIEVIAKDIRSLWDFKIVPVTEYYNSLPGATAKDLLIRYTEIGEGKIDFPVMENGIPLETQWVETPLGDMIPQICERFGYFPHITNEGIITARKIARDNPVVHSYGRDMQIVDFSPDDSYSDFTNRVTIMGEERGQIEVLYDEERMESLSGTVGWWGYKNTFTVNYSEDRSRRCRYPRLEVIESATGIAFKLAGQISEKIKSSDDFHCVVQVKAPSLVVPLIIAIAGYIAAKAIPDKVVVFGFIGSVGGTISIGRLAEGVFMLIIMMILGSVGNFQYEIHARPVGYVRRSIEASADDEAFQGEIGEIIEDRQEGWCTYNIPQCKFVAEFELMLAQLQRDRVSFNKSSHLQDEVGDTIEFLHPHTGWKMKFFVTDLLRTWRPGATCIDYIEGWVL